MASSMRDSSSAIRMARRRCRSGSRRAIRSRTTPTRTSISRRTPLEDFQQEILRNEPALELLTPLNSDDKQVRLALVSLSLSARRRHAGKAPRDSRLPGNAAAIASRRPRIDWEDYLWNSAHARCVAKRTTRSHRVAAQQLSRRGANAGCACNATCHGRCGDATSSMSPCCTSARSARTSCRICSSC